jgi:hypothetical protein
VCVLITFYICCLISDSPFRPLVVDPSKVIVSGGWQPLLDEHGKIPLVVNKEKQIAVNNSMKIQLLFKVPF